MKRICQKCNLICIYINLWNRCPLKHYQNFSETYGFIFFCFKDWDIFRLTCFAVRAVTRTAVRWAWRRCITRTTRWRLAVRSLCICFVWIFYSEKDKRRLIVSLIPPQENRSLNIPFFALFFPVPNWPVTSCSRRSSSCCRSVICSAFDFPTTFLSKKQIREGTLIILSFLLIVDSKP